MCAYLRAKYTDTETDFCRYKEDTTSGAHAKELMIKKNYCNCCQGYVNKSSVPTM